LWVRLALREPEARNARRFTVPKQVTYKYLPPGAKPTGDERSKAEVVSIRVAKEGEELPRHDVGDVVQVADQRHGDEEQSFKVVMVSPTSTVTGFVGEPDTAIDNTNVFVTDTASVSFR
jgi:hypothetical protein